MFTGGDDPPPSAEVAAKPEGNAEKPVGRNHPAE